MSDTIIDGGAERHFGIYPAIVTQLVDPENLGRVQVKFPWLGSPGSTVRAWATLLSPYADHQQGLQVLPEVDSQVVVAFEAGDLRRPYILGACWNGKENLPVAPTVANNLRVIKTRAGSLLEFDDTASAAKVTLSTASGHKLVLNDSTGTVELTHKNGATITMDAKGQVRIEAKQSVEIHAPTGLNVHTATAIFDGVIRCTEMFCTTGVVSPSYSPGAGNIW